MPELSKLHEEVRRTTLGEAAEFYRDNAPRGEFVLVVRGAQPAGEEKAGPEAALERVRALREQGLSLRDAARQAAGELGVGKNELYQLALRERV